MESAGAELLNHWSQEGEGGNGFYPGAGFGELDLQLWV